MILFYSYLTEEKRKSNIKFIIISINQINEDNYSWIIRKINVNININQNKIN